jgi:hypothetical protein
VATRRAIAQKSWVSTQPMHGILLTDPALVSPDLEMRVSSMLATLIFLVGFPALYVMLVVAAFFPGLRLYDRPATPVRPTLVRVMAIIALFGLFLANPLHRGQPHQRTEWLIIWACDPCYVIALSAITFSRPLSKIGWLAAAVILGFVCALVLFLAIPRGVV